MRAITRPPGSRLGLESVARSGPKLREVRQGTWGMTRGSIIAVLFVIELAIIGEAVVAVQGGRNAGSSALRADAQTAGSNLVEGGTHRVFAGGSHPALTVDIGYADLTILTRQGSDIDVSVSPSTSFGIFRAKAPISAREDGDAVAVATNTHGWSTGDDRMVTVYVPPETRVSVVEAGDIKVEGLRGEASIDSVGSGSVLVDDFNGPSLHIESDDGPISMHQIVAARLEATSSDSHIDGSGLLVRDGSVESDGRVTLGFASGADTLVTAEAKDGKIRTSGFPATVSTDNKTSDDDDDSSSRTLRIGAGSGHLDVQSNDGNVTLAQEGSTN
jgi:hypothetical protein